MEGWGAHMGEFSAQGVWSLQESDRHINVLELKAVHLGLKALISHFPDHKVIKVMTDNSTVAWYINKQGGTKSPQLVAVTWNLLAWCNARQLTLQASHIAGILNVLADSLSRQGQVLHTERSLDLGVFKLICQQNFTPMIDLFATRHNHKLPLFVSPMPDILAIGVDAFQVSWEGKLLYAFPPPSLVPRVVDKLLQCKCVEMLLVAPYWDKKIHCLQLMRLAVKDPMPLPQYPKLLKQPHLQVFHQNLQALNLHAFWLKLA